MRANPVRYELRAAANLEQALAILAAEPGEWTPFAGGTDLMVSYAAADLAPGKYLSIWGLDELSRIEEMADHVVLGALTTYTEIREHPTLARFYPALCQAARETGGYAIQNRGTLGGNIANGSPAADSPPALLAYGADVELVSAQGSRWVAYERYHTGYKQSVRRPDELISRIRLPLVDGERRHYYRKVGTRRAQAISKVVLAACGRVGASGIEDVRIGVGSVAPTVVRCFATEAALVGRPLDRSTVVDARAAFEREIAPIDDIRSTRDFRLKVAGNLLEEFLDQLA